MNNARLTQLLDFYKEDPDDPFNLYCLATEYRHHDEEKAREYYEKLLSEHPDYLPTYYHIAQLYAELDDIDLAEEIADKGIELAIRQNDELALRELKNLLDDLLDY